MGVPVLSGPGHVPVLEDRTGPAVHPPDQGVSPAAAMAGLEQLQRAPDVALAPLSDTLDALTFLSLGRAWVLIGTWVVALAAWGALRPGSPPRRVLRAGLGAAAVFLLAAATVVVPRPVPRLESADSSATVIDYHAHTAASHDGRRGWSPADLAAWHAAQGFPASYVTDHNVPYPPLSPPGDLAIRLLPGVEWSVYRQHVVALGDVRPINRDSFSRDPPAS